MAKYIEYKNREEWLAGRKDHIGASEIGVICGVVRKSPQDIWKEKTGRKQPDDLSGNELVEYGTKAEEHLRALFALKHVGEYKVEYHQFRVYQHDEYDWLTCTLDGELIRFPDNERGILEIKTKLILSAGDAEEWNGRIPTGYYCQVCEQMAVMKYSYAILLAELRHPNGNAEIKEYMIEKAEAQDDMDFVVTQAVDFHKFIEEDKEPPIKLTL